MSSVSAPFGLRASYHAAGGLIRNRALKNGISAAYANPIYNGQPVKFVTAGVIQEVAANTDEFVGAFDGCTYTPVGDRPRVSNYWPGGVAFEVGSMTAFFFDDPYIVYEIQADGSVAQTAIAGGTDFTNFAAGNASTGLAATTCSATIAGSGTKQLRVIDLGGGPDNDWGDAFTILRVLIALHQYTGNKAVI